jgi:HK97 family phage major capsid protein
MNFAQLIAFAKKQGYTGPCDKSNLDAIRDFLAKKAGGADRTLKITTKSGVMSIKIGNISLDDAGNLVEGDPTLDIMIEPSGSTGGDSGEEKGLDDANVIKNVDTNDIAAKVIGVVEKNLEKAVKDHVLKFTGEIGGGMTIREKNYNRRIKDGTAKFSDYKVASAYGDYMMYLRAKALGQSEEAANHLREAKKTLTMTPGSADVLGTEQIIPDVLKQVDDYGKTAQRFNVVPLSEQSATYFQALASILTVTYPPEATTVTDTNANYRRLKLDPRKGMVITKMSRESKEDSKINLAEQSMDDIARSFAYAEDRAAINGDGTGTFGGMIGLQTMFSTAGAGAGLTLSTAAGAINTTYAGTAAGDGGGYALGHFQRVAATLPPWVYEKFAGDVAWHCTRAFYEGVMKPLAIASARATATEVLTLQGSTFLSFPVVFWENMNRTASTGTSTIDCFFGSMKSACYLGRRNDLEINVSDQRYWDEDSIGIRGTMRHDVNVLAAVGSTSTPGPVIALYQS